MPETIEYYLSKGFDRAAAEYFAAGRRKILSVKANDDYTLTLDVYKRQMLYRFKSLRRLRRKNRCGRPGAAH